MSLLVAVVDVEAVDGSANLTPSGEHGVIRGGVQAVLPLDAGVFGSPLILWRLKALGVSLSLVGLVLSLVLDASVSGGLSLTLPVVGVSVTPPLGVTLSAEASGGVDGGGGGA